MLQSASNDLLETADVARLLERTPAAIRVMVRLGKIPVAFTTPRGGRLFRRVDIEMLIRNRRQSGRVEG
jgi:hypothetical protein